MSSDQLAAALLTAAEIGPRWQNFGADWWVEEPGVPGGMRCGRILWGVLDDGLVLATLELVTRPTTTPVETAAAAMRRRPPPADVYPFDWQVGDVLASVELGQPCTPDGFGDDAVAVPATGVTMVDYPAATMLVLWNDRGVQVKVGSVNYSPEPFEGHLTFDGLRLAEHQRDKIRAALPE